MGPVIFLSLITAIGAAESISELTRQGSKILKRFLLIAISRSCWFLVSLWALRFSSLGLSMDYVGLFSLYNVFIRNAASAYGILFRTLELTEAAYRTNQLNIETFNRIPND